MTTGENGKSFDSKFTSGQPVQCKKGMRVSPRITLADQGFANKQSYSTIIYLAVDYHCGGEKFCAEFESGCRTRPDPYELIACERDKIDFMPFYIDYYNPSEEE